MITKNDVVKVAMLSKLRLSEEEVEKFRGQLDKIISVIEDLREVNTDGVAPLFSPIKGEAPLREDRVESSNIREQIVNSSPCAQQGRVVVPQVVG